MEFAVGRTVSRAFEDEPDFVALTFQEAGVPAHLPGETPLR